MSRIKLMLLGVSLSLVVGLTGIMDEAGTEHAAKVGWCAGTCK